MPVDSAQYRERLRQFETLCRQHRLALTVQRRTILEIVLRRTDHPTADQVYEEIKGRIPRISRTTAYRVLEKLVEIGVITKACSLGGATRFDPTTRHHHHLVCLHCDKLIDLDDARLEQRVELPDVRAHAFQIQGFSVYFRGICAVCRRKLRAKATATEGTSGRTKKRAVRKGNRARAPQRGRKSR
jgi:Fur family peroxide stress response transcriptional regulator